MVNNDKRGREGEDAQEMARPRKTTRWGPPVDQHQERMEIDDERVEDESDSQSQTQQSPPQPENWLDMTPRKAVVRCYTAWGDFLQKSREMYPRFAPVPPAGTPAAAASAAAAPAPPAGAPAAAASPDGAHGADAEKKAAAGTGPPSGLADALGEVSKAFKKVAEEMEQQMKLRRRPWSAFAVGAVAVTLAWFITLFWLFWWYYMLTNGGQLTVKQVAYKTATGAAADLTKKVTLQTVSAAGSLCLEAMSLGTSAAHTIAGAALGSWRTEKVGNIEVKLDRAYWKNKGFTDERIDMLLKDLAAGYRKK